MAVEKAVRNTRTGPAAQDLPGQARRLPSLRGHADFNKLWAGQAVSEVGSEVTKLALPLTAVLYLHANAGQVGLMTSATLLAYAGPSLLFGVLADRVRRRRLMLAADAARAVLLTLIPVLAWAGQLSMTAVYLVALAQGAFTVIFEVAYRSYLPSLVHPELLLAGNSRLQATESVSQVGGPAVSGILVQLLTAPFALLVDAVSFLVSVVSLLWIRGADPEPLRAQPAEGEAGLRRVVGEVREGLRFIYRNPVLRSVAGSAGTFNFFSQLQLTLYVLYAARQMRLGAGAIGLTLAFFGVGGVVAAMTQKRVNAWLGYGRVLIAGYSLGALAILFLPMVPGPPVVSTACFAAVYLLAGLGIVTANITMMTLRQLATPAPMQGRMHASFRFVIGAVMPFSAAIAGVLGQTLGLRTTLFICAAGMPISVIWVALSPTRRVRTAADLGGPA